MEAKRQRYNAFKAIKAKLKKVNQKFYFPQNEGEKWK